ncbi:MAG: uridine kinase [Deltaproteobacteria bacterium]|nr:uridine kinase [Deltaproteobacteria bacterium]MBP6830880.1 uridine kinase [Deltaproteobacteria bacterium]
MTVLLVGVAGGSGSGKSTIARSLVEALPAHHVTAIEHDAYYKDVSHLAYEERARINFDHPESLDNELFCEHLDALRAGRSVEKPRYDFATHTRKPETDRLDPSPIIVVEGILVLALPAIRDRLDVKLYVDTDSDIRLMRRIRRDLEQRGRTFAQVRQQYYESVRPMHIAFVEPSKRFADIIIPEGGQNRVAREMILAMLQKFVRDVDLARSEAAAHEDQ